MTSRFPVLSNSIERGSVKPVATRAAWYPEAMEGFIEFVGVRVIEQLEDDWPKTGTMKKPSKAAKEIDDILKKSRARKASPSDVRKQSKIDRGHVRVQNGYKYSRELRLEGIERERGLEHFAAAKRNSFDDFILAEGASGTDHNALENLDMLRHIYHRDGESMGHGLKFVLTS